MPIDSVALLLDADGDGMQIVANTVLSATVGPWPPRTNTPATFTLIATDWTTRAAREVTPSLEIAPLDQVDGTTFQIMRIGAGQYEARGIFFPSDGVWRMRVPIVLDTSSSYTMLIVVEAK